jgi:hypothetical protein
MSIGEPPSLGCFAASFLQFRSADKAAREPAARPFFALAPVPPTALTSSAAQNGDGRQASPIFVAADQKAEVITQPSGAQSDLPHFIIVRECNHGTKLF